MFTKDAPIGIFDSGAGGISVLRALQREMPHEDFLFFGDSKNAPYGEKPSSEVLALSEKNLLLLRDMGAKAVVIACNTATSVAAKYLREKYPDFSIIGIEPAVKPAALEEGIGKPSILVLATPRTIGGEKLRLLVEKYQEKATFHLLPAPNIVRLVEAGRHESEEMYAYLREILEPYINTQAKRGESNAEEVRNDEDKEILASSIRIDSVVLGCTHFPFVKKQIQEVFPYSIHFYDGAEGTARECRHRLEILGLLSQRKRKGEISLYSSLDNTELLEKLLHLPIE